MMDARTLLLALSGVLLPGLSFSAPSEEDARALQPPPEARDKMTVCGDDKGHYVALSEPSADRTVPHRLYYGDGKQFFLVPRYGPCTATYFLDPRYYTERRLPTRDTCTIETAMPLSKVIHRDGECTVRCGHRAVKLKPITGEPAQKMMAAARFLPSPAQWEPYALARDDEGKYYYVDRGIAQRSTFRLFAGVKGSMKLQKMTNVVSDSKGDIFATRTGSLRLILNQGEATWIAGAEKHPLTVVPPEENLAMIYNELGVYTGLRLGLPCDDL